MPLPRYGTFQGEQLLVSNDAIFTESTRIASLCKGLIASGIPVAVEANGIDLRVDSQDTRGVSRLEIAKRTWAEVRENDVFGRAAQLAYYFFLALFPFLICVIATLSAFGTADRGRALLGELFARILPGTAYRLIDETVAEVIQSSGPLKMSFGLVASLWSASMGMSAVMDTLNAVYKVKETRSLFKQCATAIGITLGLTLLAVASVFAVVFGNHVVGRSPEHVIAIAWNIIRWALALAVLLLALAITYYFAPNLKDRQWHWVTPGSLASVVLLISVSVGLRAYLHYSGNNSAVYGSLGAVIVLLVCLYLGGVAILSGGAFNAALESLTVRKVVGASQNDHLAT